MYTNITITGSEKRFDYIVEYLQSDIKASIDGLIFYQPDKNKKYVLLQEAVENQSQKNQLYYRHINNWININNVLENTDSYIPISTWNNSDTYDMANINIYFPQHSLDVYASGTKYALTISTWIYDCEVILGTFILNRADALIPPVEKIFINEQYYEYMSFNILDPRSLIYSDDWKEFRSRCYLKEFTKESVNLRSHDNPFSSILHVSLHPVEDDGKNLRLLNGYNGGQNNINIFPYKSDKLHLELTHNINEYLNNEPPSFICNLSYNDSDVDLKNHLKTVYEFDIDDDSGNYSYTYEFIIGNDNNTCVCLLSSGEIKMTNKYKFNSSWIFTKDNIFKFTDAGIKYEDGLYAAASLKLKNESTYGEINILSNKIPMTMEVFKYFAELNKTNVDSNSWNSVNIDEVNMNIYNINAVNKIIQEVTYVDNLDQAKSNIISPTFFRAVDSQDIDIYPETTENICINLDPYKPKVDVFFIKIEGVLYQELGRVPKGVIFKVNSQHNPLPNKIKSGTYYILNQDYEQVTKGKYRYIS